MIKQLKNTLVYKQKLDIYIFKISEFGFSKTVLFLNLISQLKIFITLFKIFTIFKTKITYLYIFNSSFSKI